MGLKYEDEAKMLCYSVTLTLFFSQTRSTQLTNLRLKITDDSKIFLMNTVDTTVKCCPCQIWFVRSVKTENSNNSILTEPVLLPPSGVHQN